VSDIFANNTAVTATEAAKSSRGLSSAPARRPRSSPASIPPELRKFQRDADPGCDALRGIVKELAPDAAVLEAADSRQAMHLVKANPDVHLVLLDLNLPDRDGFSILVDLCSHYAGISCVVLSASQDRDSIVKAMDLGVLGFIPKSSPREVMVNALRLIFSGGIYIPPEALPRGEAAKPPAASACPGSPADLGLTARQVEVLALMIACARPAHRLSRPSQYDDARRDLRRAPSGNVSRIHSNKKTVRY
jgi:DNA-binding NarL/FixJ family response regulator